MKINDPNLSGASSTAANPAEQAAGAERGNRSPGSQSVGPGDADHVELSQLGASLRELQSDSPERAARLEELAAEVAAGTYNPDPAEVAVRMVTDSLQPPQPGKAEN